MGAMHISFSQREKVDLLKSWAALTLAFGILFGGLTTQLPAMLGVAAITAGLGFILHELAHKVVAIRQHCHAEYRSNDPMLLVAIVSAFFSVVLAAPGAVHVSGHASVEQHGRTAIAGPLANIALAVVFLILTLVGGGPIAAYGVIINSWLALFNLIPFGIFDGAAVFAWNKIYWGLALAASIILSFWIPI